MKKITLEGIKAWYKETDRKFRFWNGHQRLRLSCWLKEQAQKLRFLKIDFTEMVKKYIPQKYKQQTEDKKFLYLLEYAPNPNCIEMHMRILVPEGSFGHGFRGETNVHPLHSALGEIRGVATTYASSLDLYVLRITKGEAFTWQELIPHIMEVIKLNLADGKTMKEAGKAKWPSKAELAHIELMNQLDREEQLDEARGRRRHALRD